MKFNVEVTIAVDQKDAQAVLDYEGILSELQTDDLEPENILDLMQEIIRIRNLLYKKEKVTSKEK